ncbi:MAG TPA: hypothetical protein VGK90_06815 [Rhizomicrobium sp.]|jgi:hypothetical protein
MRKFNALIISILVVAVPVGCSDKVTVKTYRYLSPDNHWVVTADTIQHFGPGTAGIETPVYLSPANSDNPKKVQILYFLHNGDESPQDFYFRAVWQSPSRVTVFYHGDVNLEYQVARIHGIQITAENVGTPP